MRVLEKYRPDLVVGDEEFSSLTSALGMKVPAIMISDELELGFARTRFSRRIEGRVATWYKDLQSRVQHVLVPDFGKDGGNLRHVGPIVRERTRSRTETLQDLELPAENKLILVSMSGSGLGRFLVDRAVQAFEVVRPPKTSLLVTGEPKHGSDHRYQSLGFVRDNQDVVAAADLCITLAGKSTIDEALNFGTPLIPIPLKGHFEQEKNARELGFEHGDLSRIEYYLDRMLAHRDEPKFFRGAELTADFIAESA
jgi:UDP-N-acetylglucosamine--N-acetylmuramyl-(pentapeptide) pyrophosphoryl-undecaprenol N-acetylglucosamine transferase